MTNPLFHGDATATPRPDLLDEARCAQFSAWLDRQLRLLERRYAGFITQQSAHEAAKSAHFRPSERRKTT